MSDEQPKRRPASYNRVGAPVREFSGTATVLMGVFLLLAAAGWFFLR